MGGNIDYATNANLDNVLSFDYKFSLDSGFSTSIVRQLSQIQEEFLTSNLLGSPLKTSFTDYFNHWGKALELVKCKHIMPPPRKIPRNV